MDRKSPGRTTKTRDDRCMKREIRGHIDQIPGGQRQVIEMLGVQTIDDKRVRRRAIVREPFEECDEFTFGFIPNEGRDFGISGKDVRRRRIDDVLTTLVQVSQDNRTVWTNLTNSYEYFREQGIARRRAVKRCVGDEYGISVGRDACDHVVDGRAKTNVRRIFGRQHRTGHGEGIDEVDDETCGAQNGSGLYRSHVGEVGIVDEVARHANRRKDDRDSGHGSSVGERERGGKDGTINVA